MAKFYCVAHHTCLWYLQVRLEGWKDSLRDVSCEWQARPEQGRGEELQRLGCKLATPREVLQAEGHTMRHAHRGTET